MKIACPHCGQHYELDDTFPSQSVTCMNCNKNFTVPPNRKNSPSVAILLTPQQPVETDGKQAASPNAKTQKCPYCSGEIPSGVKKCCHCGEWIGKKSNRKIVHIWLTLLIIALAAANVLLLLARRLEHNSPEKSKTPEVQISAEAQTSAEEQKAGGEQEATEKAKAAEAQISAEAQTSAEEQKAGGEQEATEKAKAAEAQIASEEPKPSAPNQAADFPQKSAETSAASAVPVAADNTPICITVIADHFANPSPNATCILYKNDQEIMRTETTIGIVLFENVKCLGKDTFKVEMQYRNVNGSIEKITNSYSGSAAQRDQNDVLTLDPKLEQGRARTGE